MTGTFSWFSPDLLYGIKSEPTLNLEILEFIYGVWGLDWTVAQTEVVAGCKCMFDMS